MEKCWRIHVIAEKKMSLSCVAVSKIHIKNRCDEMRKEVNREVLKKRQKKMSTRLSNRVIVNIITMLRNLGPFAKPEHGVFSLPSHVEGVSQK